MNRVFDTISSLLDGNPPPDDPHALRASATLLSALFADSLAPDTDGDGEGEGGGGGDIESGAGDSFRRPPSSAAAGSEATPPATEASPPLSVVDGVPLSESLEAWDGEGDDDGDDDCSGEEEEEEAEEVARPPDLPERRRLMSMLEAQSSRDLFSSFPDDVQRVRSQTVSAEGSPAAAPLEKIESEDSGRRASAPEVATARVTRQGRPPSPAAAAGTSVSPSHEPFVAPRIVAPTIDVRRRHFERPSAGEPLSPVLSAHSGGLASPRAPPSSAHSVASSTAASDFESAEEGDSFSQSEAEGELTPTSRAPGRPAFTDL